MRLIAPYIFASVTSGLLLCAGVSAIGVVLYMRATTDEVAVPAERPLPASAQAA